RRHTRSTRDWSSDVCSSDLRNVTEEVHFAIEVAKGEHEVEEIALWLADRIAPPSGLGASEIEALLSMARPPDRQCRRCHRYLSRSEERRVGTEGRCRESRNS